MITSLRLVNFKNFADETLKVGPFTVIVGANASGKSNIRDAFRFLHGIGRGYTLAEIVEGKFGKDGQIEWGAIRGAPAEVVRFKPSFPFEWSSLSIGVGLNINGQGTEYLVEAAYNPHTTERFRVQREMLSSRSECVFSAKWDSQSRGLSTQLRDFGEIPRNFSSNSAVISQLQDHVLQNEIPIPVPDVCSNFRMMNFMELSPQMMRQPSDSKYRILGENGQNLTQVIEEICREEDLKRSLLSWLHELVPMDIQDFDFPRDLNYQPQLWFIERNGRRVSANSASDGTLRFLAILATLLSPNRGGIYFFEEIDTGIHPSRLWLLLDFIERETAKGDVQVITTTHSPALLDWIGDATLEHTSLVYRNDYWADSVIRPLSQLPNIEELRKSQGLGRLFTSNWIENMMSFEEGEADTDHLDDEELGEDK